MKYLLVPISTVGCGKSTTFRILTQLYPEWAHIENDNCLNKKHFLAQIEESLKTSNVVLFDRNNHLLLHRKEISRIFKAEDVKLIALVFVDEKIPLKKLWDTTFTRIKDRGDNHQNIKSSTNSNEAKKIIGSFIKQFQPFSQRNQGDCDFTRLQMSLKGQSSKENAKRILAYLQNLDPQLVPKIPDAEELQQLFEKSLEYKAPIKEVKEPEQNKDRDSDGDRRPNPRSLNVAPKTRSISSQSSISAFFQPLNQEKFDSAKETPNVSDGDKQSSL